jgi:hypothetical protein
MSFKGKKAESRWSNIKGRLRLRRRAAPHLPDEIVDRILSFVTPSLPQWTTPDQLDTLYNASMVSRQWYRVTLPYLYAHLRTGPDGRSAKLFAALVKNPYLGRYTRSLNANYSALAERPTGEPTWEQGRVFSFHGKDAKKMYALLNATFSNILHYLPNLEHLQILQPNGEQKRVEEHPPWLKLINQAYSPDLWPQISNTPKLDKLKRLDVDIRDLPIIELFPIFRLPALEEVYFLGGKLQSTMPGTSSVTNPGHLARSWNGLQSKVHSMGFFNLAPGLHHQVGKIARAVPKLDFLRIVGSHDHPLGANLLRAILSTFVIRRDCNRHFTRLEMRDLTPARPDLNQASEYWSAYLALVHFYKVNDLVMDMTVMHALWWHAVQLPKISKLTVTARFQDGEYEDRRLTTAFKYMLEEGLLKKRWPMLKEVNVILKSDKWLADEYVRWDGHEDYELNGVKVRFNRRCNGLLEYTVRKVQKAREKKRKIKKAVHKTKVRFRRTLRPRL